MDPARKSWQCSGQIMGHQDLGHDAGHPKPNIIWAIGGYQYPLPLMVKMSSAAGAKLPKKPIPAADLVSSIAQPRKAFT